MAMYPKLHIRFPSNIFLPNHQHVYISRSSQCFYGLKSQEVTEVTRKHKEIVPQTNKLMLTAKKKMLSGVNTVFSRINIAL